MFVNWWHIDELDAVGLKETNKLNHFRAITSLKNPFWMDELHATALNNARFCWMNCICVICIEFGSFIRLWQLCMRQTQHTGGSFLFIQLNINSSALVSSTFGCVSRITVCRIFKESLSHNIQHIQNHRRSVMHLFPVGIRYEYEQYVDGWKSIAGASRRKYFTDTHDTVPTIAELNTEHDILPLLQWAFYL